MNFKSIFLPLMFLPDFQSSRSNAFFKSIVQVEIVADFLRFLVVLLLNSKLVPNTGSSSLFRRRVWHALSIATGVGIVGDHELNSSMP